MAQTKDQQIRRVVVGLALGVLAQDVEAVMGNKQALTFAFKRAWRHWSKSSEFPSIGGFDVGDQFWSGLGRADRRRGATASWETGQWCAPYVAIHGWTVEEALDMHANTDVDASDWVELGALFVGEFKPDEVRRL